MLIISSRKAIRFWEIKFNLLSLLSVCGRKAQEKNNDSLSEEVVTDEDITSIALINV